MKKLLIGCLVIFFILFGLAVFGGYRLFHAGRQLGNEITASEAELKAIDRQFPFKAPADGKLSEARFVAWLKVRELVQAHDQGAMDSLKGIGTLRKMGRFFKMIPESLSNFAKVLREEAMSRTEYAWINDQVGGALKSRPAQKDPKLAELAEMMESTTDFQIQQGPRGRMRPRGNQGPSVSYAPLAPEDAQPVLELIKKHEAEMGKVAKALFPDTALDTTQRNGRAGGGSTEITTSTKTTDGITTAR